MNIFILILEIILGIVGVICFIIGALVIAAVITFFHDQKHDENNSLFNKR